MDSMGASKYVLGFAGRSSRRCRRLDRRIVWMHFCPVGKLHFALNEVRGLSQMRLRLSGATVFIF